MADYPSPDYVETVIARLRSAGVQFHQIEICRDGTLKVSTTSEGPPDEFAQWEDRL